MMSSLVKPRDLYFFDRNLEDCRCPSFVLVTCALTHESPLQVRSLYLSHQKSLICQIWCSTLGDQTVSSTRIFPSNSWLRPLQIPGPLLPRWTVTSVFFQSFTPQNLRFPSLTFFHTGIVHNDSLVQSLLTSH